MNGILARRKRGVHFPVPHFPFLQQLFATAEHIEQTGERVITSGEECRKDGE